MTLEKFTVLTGKKKPSDLVNQEPLEGSNWSSL